MSVPLCARPSARATPAAVDGATHSCGGSVIGRPLLGIRLIRSLRAVADVPNVVVRVREGSAVPAPRQRRRALEDPRAGLLGFRNDLVDARLAAHDVVQDYATE